LNYWYVFFVISDRHKWSWRQIRRSYQYDGGVRYV